MFFLLLFVLPLKSPAFCFPEVRTNYGLFLPDFPILPGTLMYAYVKQKDSFDDKRTIYWRAINSVEKKFKSILILILLKNYKWNTLLPIVISLIVLPIIFLAISNAKHIAPNLYMNILAYQKMRYPR